MRKTKFLGATLLVGLAALSLASCSGEDTSRTIMFYNTFGDKLQGNIKTAIDEFQKDYPGWKVTSNSVGGYDDLYSTIVKDLQANTVPDLATCYSDHVAYYLSSGKVLNMSNYIDNTGKLSYSDSDGNVHETETTIGYTEAELNDFVSSYFSEGEAKNFSGYEAQGFKADDMLTLPFSKSTELMYYNETALIQAGYTIEGNKNVAKIPTTWDELWDACAKVKAKYPESTPLAYDSEANWFITMCEQNGWDYTSADSPHYLFNNADTRAWLDDLYNKYNANLFTTQTVYGSYTSGLFTAGAEKGCVFCIGSSGGASYQATSNFKWGVAQIPGSQNGDSVDMSCISQGPSLVMFDNGNSEKAQMTWEFVKRLLDPSFQASYSMTSGYNPVRLSSYEIAEYVDHLNGESITAKAASVAKTLADQNAFYTSPAFRGSSDARLQVGAALNYVIQGTKSSQDALADAVTRCGGN